MSMQTSNHKTECNRWLKPTSLHTWPDITHNLTQEKTWYNWQTELKTKRQRKPNILMSGQFRTLAMFWVLDTFKGCWGWPYKGHSISRKPGASVAGQMAWPTIKLKSAIFCCRTISTSLLTFRSGQVSYPRRGRVFFPNETRQIRFQWWNRTPLYKYSDRDQHLDSWWLARRLAIDPEPWKHNFSWVISCVCLWTVNTPTTAVDCRHQTCCQTEISWPLKHIVKVVRCKKLRNYLFTWNFKTFLM